jgi:sialidase-1
MVKSKRIMNTNLIIWTVLLLILSFFTMSSQPAEPFRKTTVFEYCTTADDTFGYRIPALVTAGNGTLLAFAERRKGLHDHAQNDIVLRRSFDNGMTWQQEQLIADDGRNSLNDPCAVVLESGRILLIYQRFPYGYHTLNSGWIRMADTGYQSPRTTRSYLVFSDDDGESWSAPREITRMIRLESRVSVGSPGRGIQLENNEFRGRIIFPLYETIPDGKGDRTWKNRVAYSDDQGETWSLSEIIPHHDLMGFGNEAQVVELPDGSLLFNARNQGGQYRKFSRSRDGGNTWGPMRLDPGLPGVNCMGSIIIHEGELVYAGPANKTQRTSGTVRISEDDGETWAHSREVIPGSYAYSCLTTLKNGKIGLLYETDSYRRINFMSFSPAWIKEGIPENKIR